MSPHVDEALLSVAEAIVGDLISSVSTPGVLQVIMVRARRAAVESARALLEVEPHDWKTVQSLQNDVARFKDMALFLQEAIQLGDEANIRISEGEAQAIRDIVTPEGGFDEE